jgi:receptor expression-enhancing protein 5/6
MTQTTERSHIDTLQEKLDIPPNYIVYSLFGSLLLVFMGYMDVHLTNVIGTILPLYLTVKSIEKPEEGDDRQWITYWGIFIPLCIVDMFIGDYLKYLPLFYFIKLSFLIWMFLPNSKGAKTLHDRVIQQSTGPLDFNRLKNMLRDIKIDIKLAGESLLESIKEVGDKLLEVRPIEEMETEEPEEPIEETNIKSEEKLQQYPEEMLSDLKTPILESDEPRSREKILEEETN